MFTKYLCLLMDLLENKIILEEKLLVCLLFQFSYCLTRAPSLNQIIRKQVAFSSSYQTPHSFNAYKIYP